MSQESNDPSINIGTEAKKLLSKLRSGAEIRELDIKIEWHLQGVIPEKAVILMFGRGGLGKSTLMLMIGGAIAEGRELFGLAAKPAPVIYVDFENSLAILAKRLNDIDADKILFLDSSSNPPRLDSGTRRYYFDLLDKYPGAVFIFDTLRSSQSGDENDSKSMSDIMGLMRQLRDRGATAILMHHTPKGNDRKYKGSGALFDMSDHVLGLYPVKRAGDDAESDDGEEEGMVLRFGTAMKTRFEPNRLYIKFNADTRRFDLAEDPAENIFISLKAIIAGLGSSANQKSIIEAAQAENIAEKKVIALLDKGEGRFWVSRRGAHNARLFTLIP